MFYSFHWFPRAVRIVSLVLLACLLTAVLAGRARADVPVAVVVATAVTTDIHTLAADYGAMVSQTIPPLGLARLVGNDPDLLNVLAADERVTAVYPDHIIEGQPRFIGAVGNELDAQLWNGQSPGALYTNQWAVSNLRLAQAHNISQGQGIIIAVLDTGVDMAHPLLAGHLIPGYDFVENDDHPAETRDGLDQDGDGLVDEGAGHGTHIAGIINLVAPQAPIMPLRILNDDGQGSYFAAAAAIVYAADNGAHVINLSGSGPEDVPFLAEAVAYAQAHDVVVVAAGGVNALGYPAAYPAVLSVGAADAQDYPTDFSNFGAMAHTVYAPGQAIFSGYTDSAYAWWTGNSMAAPFVAGTAALMRVSAHCQADCVHNTVLSAAHPVVVGPNTQVHYGRVDAYDAVAAALNQSQPDLVVQLKDGNSQADPLQIKPHINIINNGNSVPLSALTLRYWYTVDGNVGQQLNCDYAAISCAYLTGAFGMTTSVPGADAYMELHFTAVAGTLLGGRQTGPIQLRVNKSNWTAYNEADDYSHNGAAAFANAPNVTLYLNGQLVWGVEPTTPPVAATGLKVQYRAADTNPSNLEMKPFLQVVNGGSTAVPLAELTMHYWFTDMDTAVSQFNCDWAAIGCQQVTGVWGSVNGRRYLEIRFNTGAPTLPAGGQTGEIQLRLHHTNWSAYNESDDHSFAPALTTLTDWQNVTLYHNGQLVWGVEP